MLFHTYTAVHSDGLGIFLKNNANAEMISTFTYYCHVGFAAIGGSKIRSLNSSNAYGEYAVYSAGFDTNETTNSGTIKGTMLVYTNVLSTTFQDGETITGGTSGATAKVVNVQAEPKEFILLISQEHSKQVKLLRVEHQEQLQLSHQELQLLTNQVESSFLYLRQYLMLVTHYSLQRLMVMPSRFNLLAR